LKAIWLKDAVVQVGGAWAKVFTSAGCTKPAVWSVRADARTKQVRPRWPAGGCAAHYISWSTTHENSQSSNTAAAAQLFVANSNFGSGSACPAVAAAAHAGRVAVLPLPPPGAPLDPAATAATLKVPRPPPGRETDHTLNLCACRVKN
jgi:hypothetical protein